MAFFLLIASTLQAQQQWTEAQANAWYAQQPWPVGANFLPSKLLPALATGTPVLAVCEPASPLGQEVIEGGFGEVIMPGDHAALARTLRRWLKEPSLLHEMGMRAARLADRIREVAERNVIGVEYGDEREPKMRAFLENITPINQVKELKKPIFIVAEANDPRVPKSEADQMVAALKQQGTPVWYLAAKDEGHGFAKKKNADFQFYATILFAEDYLLRGNQAQ